MSTNYQLGQLVRLKGLNNVSYNGKLARISYFPSSEVCCNGRYRVDLTDEAAPSNHQPVDVKPENMEHACQRCHKSGEKLMFCGKCKNARYCDRECQRIDWKSHKENCELCGLSRDTTKNPLYLAISEGDLRLVRKLVEEDRIDVNMTSDTTNTTALQAAASFGHLPIVQYLLQHGADLHKTDNRGLTVLHGAAQNGHIAVVRYLVEQGADKEMDNNNGFSPLAIAAQSGHLGVVQYLLEQGADKDRAGNEGRVPLFIAAAGGHLAIVRLLVEQGVDVNRAANDGTTPLHFAAYNGHAEVLSYLMSEGASLTARLVEYGNLPIDMTTNEEIKQLIRDEEKRRRRENP